MIISTILFSLFVNSEAYENLRVPLEVFDGSLLRFPRTNLQIEPSCILALGARDAHRSHYLRISGLSHDDDRAGYFDIFLRDSDFYYHRDHHEIIDVAHELVPAVGPVSIRNHDDQFEMILNSTDDFFENSCISGSNRAVSGVLDHASTIFVLFDDTHLMVRVSIGFSSGDIGSLPSPIYSQFHDLLVSRGAVLRSARRLGEFENCDHALIQTLPNIEYRFNQAGSIFVTSEDYISIQPEQRTCRLRITPCHAAVQAFCSFNPLALSNIHIRLSQHDERLHICDSA